MNRLFAVLVVLTCGCLGAERGTWTGADACEDGADERVDAEVEAELPQEGVLEEGVGETGGEEDPGQEGDVAGDEATVPEAVVIPPKCETGDLRCVENVLQKCLDGGMWYWFKTCEGVCDPKPINGSELGCRDCFYESWKAVYEVASGSECDQLRFYSCDLTGTWYVRFGGGGWGTCDQPVTTACEEQEDGKVVFRTMRDGLVLSFVETECTHCTSELTCE